jgi:hypothetical protein
MGTSHNSRSESRLGISVLKIVFFARLVLTLLDLSDNIHIQFQTHLCCMSTGKTGCNYYMQQGRKGSYRFLADDLRIGSRSVRHCVYG